MKYQLFTYSNESSQARSGIAVEGVLYDLLNASTRHTFWSPAFATIAETVADWEASHNVLRRLAVAIHAEDSGKDELSLKSPGFKFLPPLLNPGVIYAAGANYRDHVEAMNRAFKISMTLDPRADGIPPWHFIKGGQAALSAHEQTVAFPEHSNKLDWEAELAVVIGRAASKVDRDSALDYVAGYSCANDMSARDNLVREKVDTTSPFRFDWIGHKMFSGACPLGPFITPAEYVKDPEDLDIKLWLNDELKQDSNTRNHLYSLAEQIAHLSHRIDLRPGDIILTGTPAGVGMESGTFLKRGDVMRVSIEGLGELKTTVA